MATRNIIRIGRITDVPFRCLKKCQRKIHTFRLVVNIFLYLPVQELERYEFIQFCRSYSQESDWLVQVAEFESLYRPDEVIQWYTRPSAFPSKMINTICRTQNPILISKIRYFLKHIHEKLTELYSESLVWMPNFVTVYRGQRFSLKDFKRLVRNRGKKIFTTTPLSTTNSSEVAATFSGYNNSLNESSKNVISVVFKIVIQTQTARPKPFAYIQEYSHIKDEKEILISIHTIISFVDIRKLDEDFYEISLIHGRDEEETEKELMRIAIESCSDREETTVNDFLTSMNIPFTSLDDFHCQPLTSFLDENPSDIVDKDLVPTLDVNHDHLIIWLDDHIGKYNACNDLKYKLWNAIDITTNKSLDSDEIDRLIQVNSVFIPVRDQLFFVTTMEECLELIDKYYHRKIFLITSGKLGAELVLCVREKYPYIEKIFIFCGDIRFHMDWAFDFIDNLLMFNFHDDLLSRVVYEIGMYYLKKGIIFSNSNDHRLALHYFYDAIKLIMRANFIFQPYFLFSLTNIKEFITNEEAQLPRNIVQSIRNNLSYR